MKLKDLTNKMLEKKVPQKTINQHKDILKFIADLAKGIDEVEMWSRYTDSILPFRIIVGAFDFTLKENSSYMKLEITNPTPKCLSAVVETLATVDWGRKT